MRCIRCGRGCACERQVTVSVDRIIAEFVEAVNMPEWKIRGRQRDQRVATLRHLCVYLTYMLSGLSYPRLAILWQRDHSTLINSVQMAKKLIAAQPGLAHVVSVVDKRLRAAAI